MYYALRDREVSHLADALPNRNPYWQFEEIMALEDDLGVRSTFYFLNKPHILAKSPRTWLDSADWVQYLGRYDVTDPAVVETIRRLDAGGWEVGLHGSFRSADNPARLRREKAVLEGLIDAPVLGGRQHYLNLEVPETWRHHAAMGLRYDPSLGSSQRYGFQHGYGPLQPFGDSSDGNGNGTGRDDRDDRVGLDRFDVFPLTVLERTLPDPAACFDEARASCEGLLAEAAENEAVMTAVWHLRFFSEADFPGYRWLYRRLIERALEMGAWVGPLADCYRKFDLDHACDTAVDTVKHELTKV